MAFSYLSAWIIASTPATTTVSCIPEATAMYPQRRAAPPAPQHASVVAASGMPVSLKGGQRELSETSRIWGNGALRGGSIVGLTCCLKINRKTMRCMPGQMEGTLL